jgi:membrane protease YdiL (CAAX protease family)
MKASASIAPPPFSDITPPWRLIVFILACAVGVMALRLVLPPVAGWLGRLTGTPVPAYTVIWALAGGLLVGHAWTFRMVEPRGWSYVGLGREALRPGVVAGAALLGAVAIALPSAVLLGLGWLRVVAAPEGNSLGAALGMLPLLAPAALWEELLLRGYAFAVVREAWGTWRALLVTSAIFGLLHLMNAESGPQSVALVTVAGIFLGAILVRTRSLYAAWAAHLAWNLVMAAGLHAAVSGVALAAPDYRVIDAGPDWATGGPWGPEGGLFAALAMAASTLFLLRRPRGRAEPDA